jgi:hypothetical protein
VDPTRPRRIAVGSAIICSNMSSFNNVMFRPFGRVLESPVSLSIRGPLYLARYYVTKQTGRKEHNNGEHSSAGDRTRCDVARQ